jgi:cytochrome c oxidase subunit IV
MSDHAEHAEHAEHVVPVSTYVTIFFALLVGTALTTWVAYIDLGVFNTVVALLIAVIKMSLVVLFFMHVKYNKGLSRIVIVAAFFWLCIMISITLADELSRGWTPPGNGWNPVIPLITRLF